MPANKIRLTIAGSNYVLWSNDSEEYVQGLAERLDNDMAAVMSTNPTVSVTASAVLSALDYLDELEKSTAGTDNMRSQIQNYLEDAAKAKLDAEEARREAERLREENQRLREELSR